MEEKKETKSMEEKIVTELANITPPTLQDNTIVTRLLTSPPNTPVQRSTSEINFIQLLSPTRRRRRCRSRKLTQTPKRTQGGHKRKRRHKTKRKRKRKRRKKRTRRRR